ncbi:hypothetical protein PINS_up012183 [Pythium insidiosum]|nr:hypothetical protein PINS_up012183 [Pythium insidiosum]
MTVARDALHALQALASQWMDSEREGIALIEGFESALLAARAQPAPAPPSSNDGVMQRFGGGSSTRSKMDPWLLEDLFAQSKALRSRFHELLSAMYAQQDAVSDALVEHDSNDSDSDDGTLRVDDYAQHIAQQVATYEAEFQHIEALLAAMTFEITTDELRTLAISWSTSPFLDPEHSRAFRQRRQQQEQQ